MQNISSAKQWVVRNEEKILLHRKRMMEEKTDVDISAKLVTFCWNESRKGFAKWLLRLLAGKMGELKMQKVFPGNCKTCTKKN